MQQTRSAGMNRATPYLYVIPCILLLGIFVYIPLVVNFFYSTQTFSAFSPTKTFVGLTNYKEMLADPVIRTAIVNNIWYCVISVIFQVGLSLCIAAVLEDKLLRHVSTMLRTMYFLPVLISMTVVALLFSFVYHPKIGLINAGLKMIGLGNLAHAWTGATDTAIFSAIAMSQWHSMGYTMMLFIVAIQGIPEDLYEAARIDGASPFVMFTKITMPYVLFVTTPYLITQLVGNINNFNVIYFLTGGTPATLDYYQAGKTDLLVTWLYKLTVNSRDYSYAATIGILVFIICSLLSLITFRRSASYKNEEAFQ